MATIAGSNNNPVPARNVYGASSGPSLGSASNSMSPFDSTSTGGGSQAAALGASGGAASTSATSQAAAAASGGFLGQPFTWWLLLVVLLIGLKFLAQKVGEGEQFSSIKVSIHNVLVISMASIIGIGFFKVVFNRWTVPGLTTYINAV